VRVNFDIEEGPEGLSRPRAGDGPCPTASWRFALRTPPALRNGEGARRTNPERAAPAQGEAQRARSREALRQGLPPLPLQTRRAAPNVRARPGLPTLTCSRDPSSLRPRTSGLLCLPCVARPHSAPLWFLPFPSFRRHFLSPSSLPLLFQTDFCARIFSSAHGQPPGSNRSGLSGVHPGRDPKAGWALMARRTAA